MKLKKKQSNALILIKNLLLLYFFHNKKLPLSAMDGVMLFTMWKILNTRNDALMMWRMTWIINFVNIGWYFLVQQFYCLSFHLYIENVIYILLWTLYFTLFEVGPLFSLSFSSSLLLILKENAFFFSVLLAVRSPPFSCPNLCFNNLLKCYSAQSATWFRPLRFCLLLSYRSTVKRIPSN